MKFHVLNRKVHYWASIVVALPVLVIIVTGILLQLKKELPWVQPPEQRGVGKSPGVSLARILEVCRTIPEAEVRDWSDINRIDIRPSRGMLKVWAKSNWEIQLDADTAEVLQVAYRRSDLIESIHDGSWFHDLVKHWVFLPSALTLLLLWATGLYLFLLPFMVRRKRQTAQASPR